MVCSVGTEIFVLSRDVPEPPPSADSMWAEEGPAAGEVPCGVCQGDSGSEQYTERLMYIADSSWIQHLDGEGWDRGRIVAAAEAAAIPGLKLQVRQRGGGGRRDPITFSCFFCIYVWMTVFQNPS